MSEQLKNIIRESSNKSLAAHIKPDIRTITLTEELRPDAAAVVIDVVRAFTCSALAIQQGATSIFCTADLEQARRMKLGQPELVLMGEERGLKPDGFQFGNSPLEMIHRPFMGAQIIQRTSNGTRGLVSASHAQQLWAASALNASATAHAIRVSGVKLVDIIVTDSATDEDAACADFISKRVRGGTPSAGSLQRAVLKSEQQHRDLWHRQRSAGEIAEFAIDVALCSQVDQCNFAMSATLMEEGVVRFMRS